MFEPTVASSCVVTWGACETRHRGADPVPPAHGGNRQVRNRVARLNLPTPAAAVVYGSRVKTRLGHTLRVRS